MVPTKETATAVMMEMKANTFTRKLSTLTPRPEAFSSPNFNAVKRQDSRIISGSMIASTIRTIEMFTQFALAKLPIVQNTMF